MKIAIVDTGYVGLVTGACLAEFGHQVACIDKDLDKIAGLQQGELPSLIRRGWGWCEIPIYEPGLDRIVSKNIQEGRLYCWNEKWAPFPRAVFPSCFMLSKTRECNSH